MGSQGPITKEMAYSNYDNLRNINFIPLHPSNQSPFKSSIAQTQSEPRGVLLMKSASWDRQQSEERWRLDREGQVEAV